MEVNIKKINDKFFEMKALIILKKNGMINDKDYLKLKKDIENEYLICNRLDFLIYD